MINKNKGIQSVERAMAVLETIATAVGEVRLVELSAWLGLHKSTLHGLLNGLLPAALRPLPRKDTRWT